MCSLNCALRRVEHRLQPVTRDPPAKAAAPLQRPVTRGRPAKAGAPLQLPVTRGRPAKAGAPLQLQTRKRGAPAAAPIDCDWTAGEAEIRNHRTAAGTPPAPHPGATQGTRISRAGRASPSLLQWEVLLHRQRVALRRIEPTTNARLPIAGAG